MAKMTRRERIMAATRKERADKLPFFHYWRHSQIGWAERQCRNRGMGMNWVRPPFTVKLHGVEIQETQAVIAGEVMIRRTYSTPVGRVYEDEKRGPGAGQWHANRSWNDVLPWQTERLIKKPEDYEVLKYIVAHTESPGMYREFILSYEQELARIHGGLVYWHSCGNYNFNGSQFMRRK